MQNSTIRFIRPTGQTDTPFYNLEDLVSFLVGKGIIRPCEIKPRKGKKWLKIIDGQAYFHWATLDRLMLQFKKRLVKPRDWNDRKSLFRKVYYEIDDPNQQFHGFGREDVIQFFQQVKL
ncbi:hypothetical protein [Spirosoma sp. KNUC1025]|uniref:hypothetical protein n=1 Tax=Spirosoma sp. KNUC1025 TaxID=2894082 RepID=UPI0038682F94|nr:hypothetical protein LN737_05170 [Spirosoma sp. KNUC1025]